MMGKKHVSASAVVAALQARDRKAALVFNTTVLVGVTGFTLNTVKNAIDWLRIHGYIRSPRTRAWTLTEKGLAVGEEGVCYTTTRPQTVTLTEAHKAGATGLRGAAWRALRIRGAVTVDEVCSLVVTADQDYGKSPRVSVRHYFNDLANAGVITTKRANTRGELLYILLKNVGPLAPTTSPRGHVYDPNAGAWLLGGPQNVTAGVKAQVAE